ncbi:ABC transporter permease [Vibrio sp. PP-XX7]
MNRFVSLRRVARLLYDNGLALILLLIFSFVMLRFLPGDQVDVLLNTELNNEISQARYEKLTEGLGLDQPVGVQFIHWLSAIFQGKLGYSYIHSASVSSVIFSAVPWTISLVLISIPLSLFAGTLLGLSTGMIAERASGWIFTIVTLVSSLPGFVIGLLLFRVLGFYLNWFPTDGAESVWNRALPGQSASRMFCGMGYCR